MQNAPELLEVNMGEMQHSPSGAGNGDGNSHNSGSNNNNVNSGGSNNNSSSTLLQSLHSKDSHQDVSNGSNDGHKMDEDQPSSDTVLTSIKTEPASSPIKSSGNEPGPSTSMHSKGFFKFYIFVLIYL